jgi:hypothetical protein
MSVSSIPEDIQITNKVILDTIAEYDDSYYIDWDNIRYDVSGQQKRPWLLVETKLEEREVWFTMHRSLDEAKWLVAESMWGGPWRPEAVYNTESGGCHSISIEVVVEESV